MEVGQVRRRRPARLKSASRDRVLSKQTSSVVSGSSRCDTIKGETKTWSQPWYVISTSSRPHTRIRPVLGIGLGRELGREASWSSVRPKAKGCETAQNASQGPRVVIAVIIQLSCHRLSPHARLGGSAANQQRAPGCLVSQDAQDDVRLLEMCVYWRPLVRRCCTTAFPPPSTSEANRRGRRAVGGGWLAAR